MTVTVSKTTEEPKVDEPAAGFDLDASPDEAAVQPGDEGYVAKEPTDDDRKNAEQVFKAISKADILGPDGAVSALLQLIDVHPKFTPPEEWPEAEGVEYSLSDVLSEMGKILLKGCPKLGVKHPRVVFLWRNKEKWVSGGKTVRGKTASFNTRVRTLLSGKVGAVEINFHHFRTLNPLQRIFSLYHELRKLGADGGIQKPDFAGFYDELELFGPRVFRDMVELARVIEVGSEVTYQYQLPLFDGE